MSIYIKGRSAYIRDRGEIDRERKIINIETEREIERVRDREREG